MAKKSSTVSKTIKKPAVQEDSGQVIEQVRALAWAGQHAQAIELASHVLGRGGQLSAPMMMDLLDLRAESYIAQGKLDLALKDAKLMKKLAKTTAHKGQALIRLARVQMWMGELK